MNIRVDHHGSRDGSAAGSGIFTPRSNPVATVARRGAEAEAVLSQIEEMDAELEVAIEAYNGASVRLDEIRSELRSAQRHLSLATRSNREAQRRLSERMVALYAASQYGMGVAVSRDQLQPGDLVFFRGLGHMGMYIGSGSFIQAPRTGDVVKISSLSDSYYVENWVGARRVA